MDADALITQLKALPTAADRLRLAGLTLSERRLATRAGALSARMAFAEAAGQDTAPLQARATALEAVAASTAAAKARSSIEPPPLADSAATLHGRVLDGSGTPVPDLTVAARDPGGKVLGFACSDPSGYFLFTTPPQDAKAAVTLQVSDKDQAILLQDTLPIAAIAGSVTYRELRVGDTRRGPCTPPPDRPTEPMQHAQAMPDLLGQTEAEATALLARANLQLAERKTVEDPAPGRVVAQQPDAGSPLEAATRIVLTIGVAAASAEQVQVPELVGQPSECAIAALAEAKLDLGDVTAKPGEPAGLVAAQNPTGGTAVATGSAVALVIGTGDATDLVAVPALDGRTLTAARITLGAARLQVGEVEGDAAGLVTGQKPAAATLVPLGTSVALTLAR